MAVFSFILYYFFPLAHTLSATTTRQALKFKPGDLFDPEFNPWLDADITADECFALLCQYCAEKFSPSYLIFSNFINFMNMQFMRMMNYAVFSSAILQSMEGLGELRHVFTELLIETSRDFSLRSVPQVGGFGVWGEGGWLVVVPL